MVSIELFNLFFLNNLLILVTFTYFFIADMETECYPCIPMHSASNQKRMNHSTITMIKTEPLSEDVNVDVDDESTNSPIMKQQNNILQQKSQQFQQQTKQQNTRKTTRNQIVQQNNQNQQLLQQQNQQNQFKAAEASRVQQHTIRLSRVSKRFFLEFKWYLHGI